MTINVNTDNIYCMGSAVKKYHHVNLKLRILECMHTMICEEGYEQVSIRKLAAQLGVSSAAIYRHYASMSELFQSALIQESDRLAAYLTSDIPSSDDSLNKILKISHNYATYALENTRSFDFLFLSPHSLRTVTWDKTSPYATLRVFSDIIDEFAADNSINTSRSALLTHFWSFIFGYVLLIRSGSFLEYDENLVKNIIIRYMEDSTCTH